MSGVYYLLNNSIYTGITGVNMDKDIITLIQNRLKEVENEHNVEIIYAVESGSRAWGIESEDSDYDVRFIYKHSKDWYLSVLPKRDVIEYPIVGDLDYSGWDLKKALFLLNKSNPVLFEWFHSPVVYIKSAAHYKILETLSSRYFSPVSFTYHYLNMAKSNYKEYLKHDDVRTKKYFYVLRPLLVCMWIEKYNESPPIEFEKLMSLIKSENSIYKQVEELLAWKKSGKEFGIGKRIDELNTFIEKKIQHFEIVSSNYSKQTKPDGEYLDTAFRELLNIVSL